MKKRADYELMAPVGSHESLRAAIQGGADSVYFGIEQLNMRARSSANFTGKDLPEIVAVAREHGLKSYLAVNTVIYNRELDIMRDIVRLAGKNQVSAVIASDPSVMQAAKEVGMEVHLSTQLNISNIESLKFYANFADVVVLARELDLEQVKEITRAIREEHITGPSGRLIQVELFVHGALCMAVSGKCYLSLHEHNHSANRGDCFQVCRRGYTVRDNDREIELDIDNEYIMSPKDLKTIHFLDKILEAGVSVLKVEGRARSPEYVRTVISCYNEALHAYVGGSYGQDKIRSWDRRLASVFNRGFWDGYYLGQRLGEWTDRPGSQASRKKIYIGKGTNYFDRIGVAEFRIDSGELSVGDDILIMGPTTGIIETRVTEIRVEQKDSGKAVKGETCSIPVAGVVRRSDKLYKMVDRKK